MPPARNRCISAQIIFAILIGTVCAFCIQWSWKHSRNIHDKWEEMARVPYSETAKWHTHLEDVRFSFGVMHQLLNIVLATGLFWLVATMSEGARQVQKMPPIKW